MVWYSPTLEQSDAGADWFRCDLIAFAGRTSCAPLPATGPAARASSGRRGALDSYGLCGTAAPGARGFQRVICAGEPLLAGDRHDRPAGRREVPGPATVRKAGDAICKDLAQRAVGQLAEVRVRLGVAHPRSSGTAASATASAGSPG